MNLTDKQKKPQTNGVIYRIFAIVLIAFYFILLNATWQGNTELHTIMEIIATLLALVVGIITLARFYSYKNNQFLFIGCGFIGTAFFDGYHAVVTSSYLNNMLSSPPEYLIPWSWTASRIFLASALFLSWWAWKREETWGQKGKINEDIIYGLTIFSIIANFIFFTLAPLPSAYYPDFIFGRPWEFIATFIFFITLIAYLKKIYWQFDHFEYYLVLSLISNTIGQGMFMVSSHQLFDTMFNVAHILKISSYLFVFSGLLIHIYHIIKEHQQQTQALTQFQQLPLDSILNIPKDELVFDNTSILGHILQNILKTLHTAQEKLQQEINQRKKIATILLESEVKTRAILETAVDGIITINQEGIIESFNLAAEQIFGYSTAEVIGKNIGMLMPEPHRSKHNNYLKNYITTNQANIIGSSREMLAQHKSGRIFDIQLSVNEVVLDNQRIFSGIVRDITETKQIEAESQKQKLMSIAQAKLSDKLRGQQDISTLAKNVIQHLCKYLNAQIGLLYLNQNNLLQLVGSYAFNHRKNLANQFKIGQGIVGQAALEKEFIIISNVPADYIKINSGLGDTSPQYILVLPFLYAGQVKGVIELGTLAEIKQNEMDFLKKAMENIAIAFHTAQVRAKVDELLIETQKQTEELQVREEELRVANEELETQTRSLQESELKLKEKQTQLETTNAELEEKTTDLQRHTMALQEKQANLDKQNRLLKETHIELKQKAEELAEANKYKSEFLANMSHELRTPLNSLLILSHLLASNEENNLTENQIEAAQIIHKSGNDLLALINSILDLAKIEAGKMTFHIESVSLTDLLANLQQQFSHVASYKGVEFKTSLADNLPLSINTDRQRVEQILKNLLANAFKFTESGQISLNIYRPKSTIDLSLSGLSPNKAIAISVIDTGIGIAIEHQKRIFDAFQQVDGSTSRQYGGTGLGLSISKELVTKLGGQIKMESTIGKGSTFTLYLPEQAPNTITTYNNDNKESLNPTTTQPPSNTTISPSALSTIPDDRENLNDDDKILLIIEDDPQFAQILYDIAHKKAFKCIIANDGKIGLNLAQSHQPAAIILDLKLPSMSGWEVLEHLKNNPNTRHIPVHIMSAENETLDAYKKGAIGYLTKPASWTHLENSFQQIEQFIAKDIKTLLLVEDNLEQRQSIKKLLSGSDITITEASLGQTALEFLQSQTFDCMILDLSLPDMTGFELLSKINKNKTMTRCPVIVYTGKALTRKENEALMQYTDSIIIKGVKSPERLLDETALFLHRVIANMPKDKQQTIKKLYNKEALLTNKKVLIVDDDMRNSFALSKLLTDKGMIVDIAANGQKALDLLATKPDFDLVLMDIMMPVMDGLETIKRIRTQSQFNQLPILALTAKAMKGDRDKCIAAGANDYISKPIEPNRLFSILRVWLYQ